MGLPNERDCAMVMKMLFSDTFCLVTDGGYKLLAQMMEGVSPREIEQLVAASMDYESFKNAKFLKPCPYRVGQLIPCTKDEEGAFEANPTDVENGELLSFLPVYFENIYSVIWKQRHMFGERSKTLEKYMEKYKKFQLEHM